ncbi:MAG: DinB family protein [Bacteroidota bacterium]
MIRTIADFEEIWKRESEATLKILEAIPQEGLHREVVPGVRSPGRLAWHITTSIPEMTSRMGLEPGGAAPEDPVPAAAPDIASAYRRASEGLLGAIASAWTDATLEQVDEMYGERWRRGFTLQALIDHQIHHRAQLTVLLRQLGAAVPGVYGPSREEWARLGMDPPSV